MDKKIYHDNPIKAELWKKLSVYIC